MSDGVAPELLAFLQRHVSSIEQLEILLLLRRVQDRPWKAAEVAQELGMAPEAAGMRLFLLASAGLLSAGGSPDVHYRYAPPLGAEPLMELIEQAYREQRARIFEAIHAPPDPVRSFADAFKLKK